VTKYKKSPKFVSPSTSEATSKTNTTIKWQLDTSIYSTDNSNIVQINEHYYAMINPTLITKSAALGQNGVKFFSKQLVELKTNCDTIYKNAAGTYLIIFNKNANHARMKDIIGKST